MDQLQPNYLKSFKLHVGTKTTDKVLHEFLADVYEFFFKVMHTILERRQDLGLDPSIDCHKAGSSMMTLLESEKEVLEKMIKEKNSAGMDNLLRSLVDELEGLMGTAKGFLYEEKEEEEEDEKEEEPKMMPGVKITLPKK